MLFGIPWSVTSNPNRQKVTVEQAAAIHDWLRSCDLSWQVCSTVDEADQLERRLRREYMPPLNRNQRSVPVEPMPACVQSVFEVALYLVDQLGWRRRVEHPKQREAEAVRVDLPQLDVAAVAVSGVDAPALTDPLCAVGLADVSSIRVNPRSPRRGNSTGLRFMLCIMRRPGP